MLVLSRKEGERIVIGGNVVVTVTRCSGNRVTIGIDAPQEISILRGEIAFDELDHSEMVHTAESERAVSRGHQSVSPFVAAKAS